jgi:hypothetical protein
MAGRVNAIGMQAKAPFNDSSLSNVSMRATDRITVKATSVILLMLISQDCFRESVILLKNIAFDYDVDWIDHQCVCWD